jgi:protein-S-isoprenylcysteine O-methyltransferase Ste14
MARVKSASHGPYPKVRPTVVFAGVFAAGLLLHQFVPLPITAAGLTLLRVAGAALVGIGVLLFAWALALFARARTGIMFHQPAVQLMMRGPYAWSRNPQYVSFVAIYLGAAVLWNTLWPVALLPLVVVLVGSGVIAAEEQYLRATFGAAYEAYCRQVPRWL